MSHTDDSDNQLLSQQA